MLLKRLLQSVFGQAVDFIERSCSNMAVMKRSKIDIAVSETDPVYVLSYSRFSSEQQKEISIEAQQDAIHKYCEKHGYICLKDYADRAISGLTDQRPEFQQMIHDAIVDPKVT